MYAAAKAGIVNFMRSAAEFYKAKDITVNLGAFCLFAISSMDEATRGEADHGTLHYIVWRHP